jgi:integrase
LAELSVEDAEAQLALDWNAPLRHAAFYKAVYRPAILRANRLAAITDAGPVNPAELVFHSLRHAYASLCIAACRPMFEVSRFMGHSKPSTTESVYAHLLEDDHSDAMTALDAMATAASEVHAGNVIRMRR